MTHGFDAHQALLRAALMPVKSEVTCVAEQAFARSGCADAMRALNVTASPIGRSATASSDLQASPKSDLRRPIGIGTRYLRNETSCGMKTFVLLVDC